jgi:hypothetical protein
MADSWQSAKLQPEEHANAVLLRRLDRAERAYARVLTTLWIGNAGGALATLAYITANRHDGTFTRSLLVPFVLFVLGLAVIGIGSLIEFESERRALARLATSRLPDDRPNGDGPPHMRSALVLLSGACFTIGFIFGLVMLARN